MQDEERGRVAPSRDPRIICLTGPESTGKTTLARALAEHFAAPLVEEVARTYLADRTAYVAADLLAIARRQQRAEREACATPGARLVVCDTDVLVVDIWWREKFGEVPPAIREQMASRSARFYLLLEPDIPWEADPQRENPDDRDRLYERYLGELERGPHPYATVRGEGAERLTNALARVGEWSMDLAKQSAKAVE